MELLSNGLLDSLSFVQLLVDIRDEFGIEVSIEKLDLEHFRSVNAISGYVERCLKSEESNTRVNVN
jgi:acyl carrier protein